MCERDEFMHMLVEKNLQSFYFPEFKHIQICVSLCERVGILMQIKTLKIKIRVCNSVYMFALNSVVG